MNARWIACSLLFAASSPTRVEAAYVQKPIQKVQRLLKRGSGDNNNKDPDKGSNKTKSFGEDRDPSDTHIHDSYIKQQIRTVLRLLYPKYGSHPEENLLQIPQGWAWAGSKEFADRAARDGDVELALSSVYDVVLKQGSFTKDELVGFYENLAEGILHRLQGMAVERERNGDFIQANYERLRDRKNYRTSTTETLVQVGLAALEQRAYLLSDYGLTKTKEGSRPNGAMIFSKHDSDARVKEIRRALLSVTSNETKKMNDDLHEAFENNIGD